MDRVETKKRERERYDTLDEDEGRSVGSEPTPSGQSPPFQVRDALARSFDDVRLEFSYVLSATIPAFQSVLPIDVPKRLTLTLYDVESAVLNEGGYPLAGHVVGVMRSPRYERPSTDCRHAGRG